MRRPGPPSRPMLAAAATAVLLGLAGCGSDTPEGPVPPAPSTPVTAAPVPGLTLTQDATTDLVLAFRTRWAALSAGRDDSTVLSAFVATCDNLATTAAGTDPGVADSDAALRAFTDPTATQPLPSIDDAAGLGALARTDVCPAYTAP